MAEWPLRVPPASRRSTSGDLMVQALGALGWGVFFSVAPIFEALVLGAIVWIPLFFFLEFRRARKHGLFPGILLRLAIIAAIVMAAVYCPAKPEDREIVEGLSGNRITLAEMGKRTRIPCHSDVPETSFILPSTNPSLRQVLQAIEAQTPLRCTIARCGNGASLFGGSYIILVSIRLL